MRRTNPLILGAGPAGCAAAIRLAQGGAKPLLVDRDKEVGDPLCGGFLSWQTAETLRSLGAECDDIGAHRVSKLRIFARGKMGEAPLPQTGYGLSRHRLDTVLRARAKHLGCEIETDTISHVEGTTASGKRQDWESESLFLATGKHDVRGPVRPRHSSDPTLGLRIRLPASAERTCLLDRAIELHLFKGGYVGIVLQEDGTANICAALRKSVLTEVEGDPKELFAMLRQDSPALAARMGNDWRDARADTIAAVPYGFIARHTEPGLFRLGDQAAVIPSLAGEGIGIALASGCAAADHWLKQGAAAAPAYQRSFADAAKAPLRTARTAWTLAETPLGQFLALAMARHFPPVLRHLMDATRIGRAR